MSPKFSRENLRQISLEELVSEEIIGSGCYGEVRKGTCHGLPVAIKRHTRNLSSITLAQFITEAEIMAKVSHPNVVLFLGICQSKSGLLIVSEYLPGGNVSQIIHNNKETLSLYRRIIMAKDAAQGMAWLHRSNPQIVHRDLKSSNLVIDAHGIVKVCDFGLSTIIPIGEKITDMRAKGSHLWMAPEVMQSKPYSYKCDIYSFGIVLWEIVTREKPYSNYSELIPFKNDICELGVRPHLDTKKYPPALVELIGICWSPNPDKRPDFDRILKIMTIVLLQVAVPVKFEKMWNIATWEAFLKEHDPYSTASLQYLYTKAQDLHWSHAFWIFLHTLSNQMNVEVIQKVGWKMFLGAFLNFNKISLRFTPHSRPDILKSRSDPLYEKLTRLRYVLTNCNLSEENPTVTLERWGLIVASFSHSGTSPCNFLDHVNEIVSLKAFFGTKSTEEANSLLQNQPGFYMIRYSSSHFGSWVISFNDAISVKHHRVIHTTDGDFQLEGDSIKYKSLVKLLEAKCLDQSEACHGSPYKIPEYNKPSNSYVYLTR